jgi:hypothetical protein
MKNNTSDKPISPKKQTILAWGALFYGFLFLGIAIFSFDTETGKMLLVMGLAFLLGGIGGVYYLKQKKLMLNDEKLNRLFYDLVLKNKGRVTALEFAIISNHNPKQARAFIEAKAIQLGSVPEIDEEGTIIYIFK